MTLCHSPVLHIEEQATVFWDAHAHSMRTAWGLVACVRDVQQTPGSKHMHLEELFRNHTTSTVTTGNHCKAIVQVYTHTNRAEAKGRDPDGDPDMTRAAGIQYAVLQGAMLPKRAAPLSTSIPNKEVRCASNYCYYRCE
jgi:hypothetical protein